MRPIPVTLVRIVPLLLVLLVTACADRDPFSEVRLPETPVATLRPTWALVRSPYLRLFESADQSSPITGHLRAGDVVRVLSIGTVEVATQNGRARWYQLELDAVRGWSLGGAVELYSSQERARNAARIRQDGG